MLHVHAQNFSGTKLSSQARLSRRGIPSTQLLAASLVMANDPETPAEKLEQRRNLLEDQRAMLQHVPAWLRYRGMTQREVAEKLGVREASFSKWLSGTDAMKVGFLRQLAALLKADAGDLIAAPPGAGLSAAVSDLMDAAEGLNPEQLRILSETARMLGRKTAS